MHATKAETRELSTEYELLGPTTQRLIDVRCERSLARVYTHIVA